MATILPNINSSSTKMTTGERRFGQRLEKFLEDDYLCWFDVPVGWADSEPLPIADTFTFENEDGSSLSQIAPLDTMVIVVDAVNFLSDYYEALSLQGTGENLGEEDERNVVDLLVDQVELAMCY